MPDIGVRPSRRAEKVMQPSASTGKAALFYVSDATLAEYRGGTGIPLQALLAIQLGGFGLKGRDTNPSS
jgi:hypothetical protein